MLSSLLKHREALLGAVIILMIVAIGSRVPSFIAPISSPSTLARISSAQTGTSG